MTEFANRATQAANALRDLFAVTPLQRNLHLSDRYQADIWLKREDLGPVRSYKLRGAFTAMRQMRTSQPGQSEFVCASAGNHAQGMAYACRHFGVHGTIFMPVTTPQQKIDKTRVFGQENTTIRLTGDIFFRRCQRPASSAPTRALTSCRRSMMRMSSPVRQRSGSRFWTNWVTPRILSFCRSVAVALHPASRGICEK